MAQTEKISPLEPFEQNDELQLVAEVLRKDRKATAEFINRYADSVYCYVRRRVVPKIEVADDLVQETFLAAWQNLGTYRGQAPVRSWLLGIARHKVEDYYRRKMQEVELPEDGDEPCILPVIEDRLDGDRREKKIRRVLAGLPEAYAVALQWRYLENRSVREIAMLSGKTEKAVERLLARARENFKRRWSDGRS